MSEQQPQPQQIIGNYKLTLTIGKGAFGKVKKAQHIPTKQNVAVKVLQKNLIYQQSDVQRISRQIKILKLINNQYLIKLYQIIQTQQRLYLIMQFAKNGDLFQEIVNRQKIPEQQVAAYYYQILLGIKYLHSLGITHRDLKPQNLLLDNKKIKIADFGLGNFFKQGDLLKTACGSPCYAAPQMVSKLKYNPIKVDVWSSGIILYAMVFGCLPFEDAITSQLYTKIKKGQYRIPKYVSSQFKDLLKNILNINPQQRYDIDTIIQHPWMQRFIIVKMNNQQKYLNDENILSQICEQYKLDKDKLIRGIETNKHNTMTTIFYLAIKKYQRNMVSSNVTRKTDSDQKGMQKNAKIQIQQQKNQTNQQKMVEQKTQIINQVTINDQSQHIQNNKIISNAQQISIQNNTQIIQPPKSPILIQQAQKNINQTTQNQNSKNPYSIEIPNNPIQTFTQYKQQQQIIQPRKTLPIPIPSNKTSITKNIIPTNKNKLNKSGIIQKKPKLQKAPRMQIQYMKKTAVKLYQRSISRSNQNIKPLMYTPKHTQQPTISFPTIKIQLKQIQRRPRLMNTNRFYVGVIQNLVKELQKQRVKKQGVYNIQYYEINEQIQYIVKSNLQQQILSKYLNVNNM